ncbi:hypothetical protein [uncultured Dialister sp.]|uniref:hypothetical protein n=1 Tax=uncultured Dialister sp. TaxID=278064 RepID=UPI0020460306|nr:hypothetical protein [uncultured Dialister sp.]DAV49532.1 MAG TPA: tail assembly chaperone protein [Caudoviricetes sp.]
MLDISYNKVTRVVWVKIGNKVYHFRLSINGLQELEATAFGGQSYFDFQKAHNTMPLSVLREAYRIMLSAAGDKEEAKDAANVIEKLSMEEGIQQLEAVFYVTLAVSGIFGVKQSNQMLKTMRVKSRDIKEEKDEEPKNG